MTDAAIRKRWTRRLHIRRQLLEDAERDLAHASGANRPAARKRVKLREEQVAFAKRVLDNHEKPKLNVRERAVRSAMLGVKHRDQITYTQGSARWDGIAHQRRAFKNGFPVQADCSSFVSWCLWDALGGPKAGNDIINGANWTGGFTGTQCSHGKRIAFTDARPGDLLFYRGANGAIGHVTMYLGAGKAVSHGSDAGPQIVNPSYRPIAEVRSYLS